MIGMKKYFPAMPFIVVQDGSNIEFVEISNENCYFYFTEEFLSLLTKSKKYDHSLFFLIFSSIVLFVCLFFGTFGLKGLERKVFLAVLDYIFTKLNRKTKGSDRTNARFSSSCHQWYIFPRFLGTSCMFSRAF